MEKSESMTVPESMPRNRKIRGHSSPVQVVLALGAAVSAFEAPPVLNAVGMEVAERRGRGPMAAAVATSRTSTTFWVCSRSSLVLCRCLVSVATCRV